MKTKEELKQEQYDLKARLHEVIEFTNSKEYFELSPREKGLIAQQRAGMEMYLNALTNRIYSVEDYSFDASTLLWPMMLGNLFNSSSFGGNSLKGSLNESDFEAMEEKDE